MNVDCGGSHTRPVRLHALLGNLKFADRVSQRNRVDSHLQYPGQQKFSPLLLSPGGSVQVGLQQAKSPRKANTAISGSVPVVFSRCDFCLFEIVSFEFTLL